MSIPLVQNNEKDSINTSIIAIKRNIERINMLLGLSNSEEIDTSEFVKKSDIVDEVTIGNMKSITSNAVAESLNNYISNVITTDGLMIIKNIRYVAGTMPTDASQVAYINLPVLGNNEYIIILGGRVLRTSTEGYEYDIPTVGACLYESVNHRFYISIRPEFVPYVGGKPIGILYAVFKLV